MTLGTGHGDAADYTCQEQDAYRLERQQILESVGADESMPDGFHIDCHARLDAFRQRYAVDQGHEEDREQEEHRTRRRHQHAKRAAVGVEERSLVVRSAREQNREDEQDHDASRIDRYLHGAEELISELEIEYRGSDQYEEQVSGRAKNLAARHRHHRENSDADGHHKI